MVKGNPSPKIGVMVEEKDGALAIAGISKKGPAEKAGLEKGDIIQAFDGQPIADLADLKLALYYCRQDQTTTIRSSGETRSLKRRSPCSNSVPSACMGKNEMQNNLSTLGLMLGTISHSLK